MYRILSREKDYESQAMVFFLRDYSGSMERQAHRTGGAQHVLIYSWLLYQYARQVETRFILHDTEAKEVPDFYTYYNSRVAGGTKVASAYTLVNEIVAEGEPGAGLQHLRLPRHRRRRLGHRRQGQRCPSSKAMLAYANRVGITIAEHGNPAGPPTEVERYIKNSGLLEEKPRLLRLDVMQEDAGESRVIEGIKKLISE